MFCKKSFALAFVLSFSLSAFAAVDITTNVKVANVVGIFPVGIGSVVQLKSEDNSVSGEAIFVGSTVKPNGENSYQMYLHTKSKKILYIDADHFSRANPNNKQKVLDSYEQTGGTCSAYAINNFLQQTHLTGFEGTGELKKLVSTEEGRTYLLADAINEYYLTVSHQYSIKGIMNKYGKRFGFACKKLQTDSYEKVSKLILDSVKENHPVFVSYNIGPNMVDSPFALEIYDQKNAKLDARLWVPRKVGERNSGGHTIVAVGAFTAFNKQYLVMLDSDWSEPRVWDMDAFLNDKKTALKEIEFISCK